MIGDHFSDQWKKHEYIAPDFLRHPLTGPAQVFPSRTKVVVPVDRDEFEALKKQVEEMKVLLEKAVEYDKRNNEPHCEQEEKIALLKAVAAAVGVDLSTVFK